jgi:glycosyltransferase involved in cell wall biosynthesis
MKIAYVDFYKDSKSDKSTSAVERKMQAQMKALEQLGKVVRHSYDNQSGGRLIALVRMVTRRLPFFPSKVAYRYDSSYDGIDAMYFRRTTLDSFAIRFFRDVKKHNPKCKIVMELPTYPYDKEMTSLIEWPRLIKDRWNRKKLKHYIDRIVTFSDDDVIFGIPTIRTMNGIDFDTVPLREVHANAEAEIHAIMVANFASWHGLDKLIDGMIQYYSELPKRKFILHIVGGGKAVEEGKVRASNSKVKDFVVFHGPLWGSSLQELYNRVTLAIDSCDFKKIEVFLSSSLKTREYVAKGLPVVSAIEVDLSRSMKEYFYRFKNPHCIDVREMIDFHDSIYHDNESYHSVPLKIRELAKTVCDIHVVMNPVIQFFQIHKVDEKKYEK